MAQNNGVFGMFGEKYYHDVPGKPGMRAINPVIGQAYEYTPIALISETVGETTIGVFNGFSAFGPALFLPLRLCNCGSGEAATDCPANDQFCG